MISEPGLFEIDADTYHADPAPQPSLNNSTIGPLLRCPALAREQHPRLNPNYQPKESTRLDLGSVAHRLLFNAGREIEIIDAADYRTNAAREARDAARSAGKLPVLVDQLTAAHEMVTAAKAQIGQFEDLSPQELSTGKFEVGLFWQDGPVWCRSLIDRLCDDKPVWEVWDYKTTETDIDPEGMALGIHVVSMGYDTQCALQERGLVALFPQLAGRIRFRWLFQNTEQPYLISVVEPDPATMTIARKKVDRAIALWAECLKDGWRGYPAKIMPLRHAEHLANRWLEREIRDFDAGQMQPPAPPKLKRKPGRPKKSKPLDSLMGG